MKFKELALCHLRKPKCFSIDLYRFLYLSAEFTTIFGETKFIYRGLQ